MQKVLRTAIEGKMPNGNASPPGKAAPSPSPRPAPTGVRSGPARSTAPGTGVASLLSTNAEAAAHGDRNQKTEFGIEWSVAARALPGQTVSGDQFLVKASNRGVLVGVIDGLGHGSEATRAAAAAVTIIDRYP